MLGLDIVGMLDVSTVLRQGSSRIVQNKRRSRIGYPAETYVYVRVCAPLKL